MLSSVGAAALNIGYVFLSLSIWQEYLYHKLWDLQVGAMLTPSTLGRNKQHISPFLPE